MRQDQLTVKRLCKHQGLAAAGIWHRAPFIDVDHQQVPEAPGADQLADWLTLPSPWRSFVTSVSSGFPDDGFCFYVSEGPELVTDTRPFAGLDVIYFVTVPFEAGMAYCAAHRTADGPRWRFSDVGVGADEDARFLLTEANKIIVRLLSYLHQSNEHLTEISPARPRVSAKTAKLKPWLRDDLPRIILLDPTSAARTYGMPTGRTVEERHAPIPHGRRGHWRRLKDSRRVWVRPAWVGPTQWLSGGQIYRVLTHENGNTL